MFPHSKTPDSNDQSVIRQFMHISWSFESSMLEQGLRSVLIGLSDGMCEQSNHALK